MNIKPKIRDIAGLILAIGLAGGSTNWVINQTADDNSGKEMEVIRALLLMQNPGEISYVSFPMAKQLESSSKIIRFPDERAYPQTK